MVLSQVFVATSQVLACARPRERGDPVTGVVDPGLHCKEVPDSS
uniref:(California timema) hypothetical protein n=1 Tax=Timema californicum TaxID=61474 RepID=A0A7R9JIZ5_TIMCA|nr:unnamed protein product [Timema californicum]